MKALEGDVAKLLAIAEQPELAATDDPLPELQDSQIARGFGRYRDKVHALEAEKRRG